MVKITQHPKDDRRFRVKAEMLIPRSRDEVFEFFSDAFNLETITPPWVNFRVITPAPIEMEVGTLIDYRLRLRGLPIRWRTRISCWDPPYQFADEQLRGPYRLWHHVHTFEEVDGGCLAKDQVDYSVPGGRWAGGLLNWLVIQRDVERIFQYRQDVLQRTFADETRLAERIL